MEEQDVNETAPVEDFSFGKKAAVFVPAALSVVGVDALLHAPLPLALAGLVGAFCLARKSPEIYQTMKGYIPLPAPGEKNRLQQEWTFIDRLLGRHYASADENLQRGGGAETRVLSEATTGRDSQKSTFEDDGEEDLLHPQTKTALFLFSEVLARFDPTLEKIFLACTTDGEYLFCHARDLCHVALAGNTGGGKSSILRMLMLQLCKIGVKVLLLNPHYTGYDLESDEDWTPFEPLLIHSPMECRKYEVIEHYLKSAAKDVIPKRLERRANSQPVGRPYFIIIDELPSIVREIKAAPEYMRIILEEGRKVGVFLISAAQDFLVKTIAPNAGGGSIRECYRTAYYVGGDPTTARVLLDMPAQLIPEDELGKGVVMLRASACKKAAQVYVPYVDNASLFRLLGPSTYKPTRSDKGGAEDKTGKAEQVGTPTREAILETIIALTSSGVLDETMLTTLIGQLPLVRTDDGTETPSLRKTAVPETKPLATAERQTLTSVRSGVVTTDKVVKRFTTTLSPELQTAYDAYTLGMSNRDFGRKLGVSHATAGKYIQRLKDKGVLDTSGQKVQVG